jgi:hypothetical protein
VAGGEAALLRAGCGPVMVAPLRRNQSDSSESKIGSRCGPTDGTVT